MDSSKFSIGVNKYFIIVILFLLYSGMGFFSDFQYVNSKIFENLVIADNGAQTEKVWDNKDPSNNDAENLIFAQSENYILTDTDSAININKLLGAEQFYKVGFTGKNVIQAEVESGLISNTHETTDHVTYISTEDSANSISGHATVVGHIMGGRHDNTTYPDNFYKFGIAYGAELVSGVINGRPLPVKQGTVKFPTIKDQPEAWKKHYRSVSKIYAKTVEKGADVINSSWGYYSLGYYSYVDMLNTEAASTDRVSVGLDAIISENPEIVFTTGAGNDGGNLQDSVKQYVNNGLLDSMPKRPVHGVSGLALGYNSISVGGLKYDTLAAPYEKRAGFSAYGPGRFYHAGKDTVLQEVRAQVDIMAPGQHMKVADAEGTSKYTNQGEVGGTSYASPIVSGGATLLVDAAHELYSNDPQATDARLIKSVLLNSAKKLPGWDNGQRKRNGSIVTTQALDWKLGAGRMNLDRAFDQFILKNDGGKAGTANLTNKQSNLQGEIEPVGWDVNKFNVGEKMRYYFKRELKAGSKLTATLDWFVDRDPGTKIDLEGASEERFSFLKLRIVRYNNRSRMEVVEEVAKSISKYNSLQHLSFNLSKNGFYGIEISYEKDLWNFTNSNTPRSYALSWFVNDSD